MIPISDDPPPDGSFPVVTLTLIAINIVVFLYELSLGSASTRCSGRRVCAAGVHGPARMSRRPRRSASTTRRLLTTMFLHGGFMHIGSNMLFLWIFGDNVEDRLGHLRFWCSTCCAASGRARPTSLSTGARAIPSVGASGAIAGVLAGYLLLFPSATVRTLLFLGPFITMTRVPAMIMIGFWFVTQFVSGVAALGPSEQTSGRGVLGARRRVRGRAAAGAAAARAAAAARVQLLRLAR